VLRSCSAGNCRRVSDHHGVVPVPHADAMSYADPLPDVGDLRANLKKRCLTNEQVGDVLTTFASYLRAHAEFHQNE